MHSHPLEITQPLWSDWCKGSVPVKSPSSLLTCNSYYECTHQELRIKNLLCPISSRIRARHGCSNMRKTACFHMNWAWSPFVPLKHLLLYSTGVLIRTDCERRRFTAIGAYIDWSLSASGQRGSRGGTCTHCRLRGENVIEMRAGRRDRPNLIHHHFSYCFPI